MKKRLNPEDLAALKSDILAWLIERKKITPGDRVDVAVNIVSTRPITLKVKVVEHLIPENIDAVAALPATDLGSESPAVARWLKDMTHRGHLATIGEVARLKDYEGFECRLERRTFKKLHRALEKFGLKHGAEFKVGPLEKEAIFRISTIARLGIPPEIQTYLQKAGMYRLEDLLKPSDKESVILLLHRLTSRHGATRWALAESHRWCNEFGSSEEFYDELARKAESLCP